MNEDIYIDQYYEDLTHLDDGPEWSSDWDDGEPCDDGDWMDSDALASAGFGMDEDYGCYGGEDY